MLTTRAYLTFRDIQECLTEYYRQNGSRIGFAEAVRILHNKRKTTETIRSIPDFRVWDLTNRGQLWDLYQDTPIDVSYIIEHPDAFHTLMPEHDSYFELGDSSIMIVLRDEAIKSLQRLSFFKIIYVLQGKCDLTLENDKRVLETGDAVILPPGILHDHRPLGDDNITIHISIKKSTFRTAFQQMLSDDTVLSSFFMRCFYEDNSSFLLFHLEPTVYICEILRNLFCEGKEQHPYSNSVENLYISIFLSELLRSYETTAAHFEKTDTNNVKIPMILTYMKSHFMQATLSSTASYFGYDASYFGKLVKKSTGMNFIEIINRYKVDHAMRLLKQTYLSIDEICSEAGFHESDHFYRVFRKYTGTTPAKYRKQSE